MTKWVGIKPIVYICLYTCIHREVYERKAIVLENKKEWKMDLGTFDPGTTKGP